MAKKTLVIVDISSFIFRSYFAIRPLSAPDGTPTNAVLGVFNMLYKLLADFRPSHLFLAMDGKEKTFRHEMYAEYKANRETPPEDLIPQFALIKELVKKMELKGHHLYGYEADDLIGSAVTQWKDSFDEVLIVSSDKDLMQFLDNEKVFMVDTMKNLKIDADGVVKKLGVKPEQVVDYLSMVGDASDNIPGMRGIGPKGAAKLLAEYGTLENCIAHREEFKGKKLTTAFSEHLEAALLSQKLILLKTDLDLAFSVDEISFNFRPSESLIDFLKNRLGFKAASKKMEDLAFEIQKEEGTSGPLPDKRIEKFSYFPVEDKESYQTFITKLKKGRFFSLFMEMDCEDFFEGKPSLMGISLDGRMAFILDPQKIPLESFWRDIFESPEQEIILYDAKKELHFYLAQGHDFKTYIFEVAQAHFEIAPDESHQLDTLVSRYLDMTLKKKEKKGPSFSEWNQEDQSLYVGERACCIFSLAEIFHKQMELKKIETVYEKVDRPCLKILAKMELKGILINQEYFQELGQEFKGIIDQIEQNIKEVLKEITNEEKEINLRSPKQLSELLFETLGLPIIRTTKTGFSTDSSVLEELAKRGESEIPQLILSFREIDKLQSTYVKALPELIHSKTGRVHTTFNSHTASTGRLSSVNPNLQNIPVRSENGKRIRKGFIAEKGHLLLSADYSQVELRLLAHFSKDPTMLKAFEMGVDIHTQTASEVLSIPLEEVRARERSLAKAVNFGLMYGQSSFGLAQTLKISRKEAKDYIESYFRRFGQIKGYLDRLKEAAEIHGYSTTLVGRKRFLPDIKSSNRNIKASAERLAINSPIQGTAADIIKLAMIEIDAQIQKQKLSSEMILQVHDELIFEVPEAELALMKELVRETMENVVKLEVPLKVELGVGANWMDLK